MTDSLLRHIAIIMDGNNRWAKQRSLSGIAGHREGVERIRDVMAACQELGVEVLTLFAFSSENWKRPAREVDALMSLFQVYLKKEARLLKKRGVRLKVVGSRERFSKALNSAIVAAEQLTNVPEAKTTLVIAADYGGRWDIAQAAARLAEAVASGHLQASEIDEHRFAEYTSLAGLPELDLLIRTGGEHRISNFVLWQAAYAELYFSPALWPDFNGDMLKAAADNFYQRQRRFGRTAEQCAEPSLGQGGSSHA
ncbi:polyprenyl diphosphate synthase [Gilvimarinus algae]|uniref:Ditrans,polycis-undecaprenyl-diphosphate synthase ((2E,6E)-farnesyl-diphosphate specific) n=1 Tax=Gilvimarinus algae TaxID=3058037 RepID=A0ABT8TGI7_9GAMM|nr:polyprenyl diphosphate synthase [Gilvimarinus sp. SDUM040014]MDO3382243.1 polyprenyl diphosphate synthase [Gilvimarinus sp. SDUM040014]